MSPRPVDTVVSSLSSKGFVYDESGKHQKLRLYVNGNKAGIFTLFSHGAKECNDFILGSMAWHLKLSRKQFDALIDCNMSGEDYIKALEGKGYAFQKAGR